MCRQVSTSCGTNFTHEMRLSLPVPVRSVGPTVSCIIRGIILCNYDTYGVLICTVRTYHTPYGMVHVCTIPNILRGYAFLRCSFAAPPIAAVACSGFLTSLHQHRTPQPRVDLYHHTQHEARSTNQAARTKNPKGKSKDPGSLAIQPILRNIRS
jgi:hypothetical protein